MKHTAGPFLFFTLLLQALSPGWLQAAAPLPEPFGKTAAGEAVEIFTLKNRTGMTVRIMSRGATIVNLIVPDRTGKPEDVVLGFDDVAGYESSANQFFGCTTGRVCNRIAGGEFTLDGKTYKLSTNNGPNHLHGGTKRSLDKVIWQGKGFESSDATGVSFFYTSLDGEEGYPGTLTLTVNFTLKLDSNQLAITYKAVTDQPTPVNLTNHSYFNLGGAGAATVLDHQLQLSGENYTPTDATLIPTGELATVAGTPLDFRSSHALGTRIAQLDTTPAVGYDHNFVVDGQPGTVRPVARLYSPTSGRVLEIQCDVPGVQLYTGNHLSGQTGKGGKTYPRRSALCLETQHFPDSVHHSNFPSTILQPGAIYEQTCIWKFLAE
ncbi:aldose epimerase family protein [Planctomicrobium piriforme]|uniref:Aldose 1-epimerase n=1 Tax=Planctomicrobium piriforme TaxID=1576369 RepID=A0A1I3S913_9PLAN|nr:aldose epimerase family protein [Planctomicrobium piriforme]SFJ54099.1 aldose 1-epimerase [Planctomicrobium piriforme]